MHQDKLRVNGQWRCSGHKSDASWMAHVSFNHPETVLEIEALTNICTLPGCDVTGWLVRAGTYFSRWVATCRTDLLPNCTLPVRPMTEREDFWPHTTSDSSN
ncbi:hypothetical protein PGT21_018857 [Puccinia graminis f. sp. tritici]|nr:hypothetical protein PGT21_018857 [Puccinia graminis f. sp. tritici]